MFIHFSLIFVYQSIYLCCPLAFHFSGYGFLWWATITVIQPTSATVEFNITSPYLLVTLVFACWYLSHELVSAGQCIIYCAYMLYIHISYTLASHRRLRCDIAPSGGWRSRRRCRGWRRSAPPRRWPRRHRNWDLATSGRRFDDKKIRCDMAMKRMPKAMKRPWRMDNCWLMLACAKLWLNSDFVSNF